MRVGMTKEHSKEKCLQSGEDNLDWDIVTAEIMINKW